jgi:DNA-binding PadR family transcriptional regulator
VITPLTYHILLALTDADRHGYGINRETEARLGERSAPTTGALYLALQRMEQEGLVAESPTRPKKGDDARRRYYRLTRSGRTAAVAESRRLAEVVALARQKDLLPEGADA